MRRFVFAVMAGLAVIVAAVAAPSRAGAVTMTAPAGLAAAIDATSAAEQVRWHRHYWWGWRWHRPHWYGWRRHYWWGFPFFAPRWYGYPHHRHHRHRAQQRPAQKQDDQPPKPEEQPSKPRQQEQEPPQPK